MKEKGNDAKSVLCDIVIFNVSFQNGVRAASQGPYSPWEHMLPILRTGMSL